MNDKKIHKNLYSHKLWTVVGLLLLEVFTRKCLKNKTVLLKQKVKRKQFFSKKNNFLVKKIVGKFLWYVKCDLISIADIFSVKVELPRRQCRGCKGEPLLQ